MGQVRFSKDGREIGEEFGMGIDKLEADRAEWVGVGVVFGVKEGGEVVFEDGG